MADGMLGPDYECVFPRLHCDCVDCIERRSKWERAAGLVVRAPRVNSPGAIRDFESDPAAHREDAWRYFGIDWGSEPGFSVPNRLKGATINNEGDAV